MSAKKDNNGFPKHSADMRCFALISNALHSLEQRCGLAENSRAKTFRAERKKSNFRTI